MPKRKSFNWSLLDKAALFHLLWGLRSQVINKKLSVAEFHSLLSKHIKHHLPINIVRNYDVNNIEGWVYVGGAYYSDEDKKHRTAIELSLVYNPLENFIKLSRYKFISMCFVFADTILHEIIHMRQFRARAFKALPGYQSTAHYAKQRRSQEYYGDLDEQGAFAFNIACALWDRYQDDDDIIAYINSNQCRRRKHTAWYKYLETFDFNHSHPVIKSMKRKIIRNLAYAKIGRPFKTSDYLTY